jgi:hypothetical protein
VSRETRTDINAGRPIGQGHGEVSSRAPQSSARRSPTAMATPAAARRRAQDLAVKRDISQRGPQAAQPRRGGSVGGRRDRREQCLPESVGRLAPTVVVATAGAKSTCHGAATPARRLWMPHHNREPRSTTTTGRRPSRCARHDICLADTATATGGVSERRRLNSPSPKLYRFVTWRGVSSVPAFLYQLRVVGARGCAWRRRSRVVGARLLLVKQHCHRTTRIDMA